MVVPPLPISVSESKSMRDFMVAVRWEVKTIGATRALVVTEVAENVLCRTEKREPFQTLKVPKTAPWAVHLLQTTKLWTFEKASDEPMETAIVPAPVNNIPTPDTPELLVNDI